MAKVPFGKPLNIGKRYVSFTPKEARSLGLSARGDRNKILHLSVYQTARGNFFCKVRGQRVYVTQSPRSKYHYRVK